MRVNLDISSTAPAGSASSTSSSSSSRKGKSKSNREKKKEAAEEKDTMDDLSLDTMFGVKGKNVVVTGGSRGIGYMIASCFVQQGCNVFIFSRKPDHEAADALTQKGPGKCYSMVCDVADAQAIETVAKEVQAKVGDAGIHCLVNNSGATWGASFYDVTLASFEKLVNVNLTGLFFVSQAFGPMLEAAGSVEDPARIINIASIDGLHTPVFEEYAYGATKAGVIHMTRLMASSLAPKNITVNSISPGLFPSKMGDQVLKGAGDAVTHAIPMKRAGRPCDIAAAALYFASPSGSYCTGSNLVIDGGITSSPKL
ncbi:Dehydrogenase/reductase SDR family member 4 [Hondaea fermentalgiana]|uniref:Dehydrogenase/reductase SDR family member 4 n=1 Tax=Hondaea fermentalgiana TaxID=2315210 RepID=A0A2R5G9S3_9STRA|nr:Dehydrogenase/reductase SDR family member 4 [Hondaea fermentalgiana]|eukprot:GBG27059.1 Dehydrogenase/reductase SDR family member 4 [Hondaea fermentalgiana]